MCGSQLSDKTILFYPAMPKSAQHFPTQETLAEDQPIDLKIVQCSSCDLVQLDNDPVPYYREVIRASAFSKEMGIFRERQFADFIEQYGLKNKKIIEIGCGYGEYLALLNKQGVAGYGLEYAENSVQQCLHDGLQVQQGYVEHSEYTLNNGCFDAFFILNFLEHIPEPVSLLKGIAHNLTCGAIGMVEVPNFDMMIRENLFTEFVIDHLCYFTRDTLQLLLGLSGFEVLECREVWDDYILSATVRKRGSLDVDGFRLAHQTLKAELNAYINNFNPGQVVIWGAGHQALAVMALAGLSGKIKYVVDSAPFKQNKLTPGTHLPIVPPEIFFQDDAVEALIVMAAAYSDEVAAIVKKRSNKSTPIAILRASGLNTL